ALSASWKIGEERSPLDMTEQPFVPPQSKGGVVLCQGDNWDNYPTIWEVLDKFATFQCNQARNQDKLPLAIHEFAQRLPKKHS
ncbi:MAG: hypothetical protein ACXWLQ_05025, partial [Rhizomicrobium sp.]